MTNKRRVDKIEQVIRPPGSLEIRPCERVQLINAEPAAGFVELVWVQGQQERPLTHPLPADWYETL